MEEFSAPKAARLTSEPMKLRSGAKKATARVLAVLFALASHEDSVGVTELSRELGMTKNMVFRALATLVELGYVVRDETGQRYGLGYKVLTLLTSSFVESDLRTICRPLLQFLHEMTGETAILSIAVGRNRVNIDDVEAVGPRVTHAQRGRAVPLHITRTGRLLLALQRDEVVEEYIALAAPFAQYPNALVRNADQLWDEIKRLRKLGYALGPGEPQSGVASANYISVPILDSEGLPHCTVSVGGPADRFTLEVAREQLPRIRAAVERFESELRYLPAPPLIFD